VRHPVGLCAVLVVAIATTACSGGNALAPPSGAGPARVASVRPSVPVPATRPRVSAATTASNVIANGGFESGSLSPWLQVGTGRGAAQIDANVHHTGAYSAFVGTSTSPEVNGYYGVEQLVTIPASGVLSMFVRGYSNDSIQYVDQEADLIDSSGTIVQNCFSVLLRTTTWTQETCDVSAHAGQSLYVFVGVYGTGYSADYLDLYVDDVSLTGGATASPSPAPSPSASATSTPTAGNAVANPGFETGALAPWTTLGNASITTTNPHSGTYAAFAGTSAAPEVKGLSGVEQTVTIPSGGKLSVFLRGVSNDSITYADQEADLLDSTGATVFQCYKVLLNAATYAQQSCDVSAYAGRSLTLFIGVNGNGYANAYVGATIDDVVLSGTGVSPAPSSSPSASASATPIATATPVVSPTPTAKPSATPTPGATATPPAPGATPIQHVVIILQENRTLENIFHGYPRRQYRQRRTRFQQQPRDVAARASDDALRSRAPLHQLGCRIQRRCDERIQ